MANHGSREKANLRRSAKLLLQRLSPEERRARSERICVAIIDRFPQAKTVATFAPTIMEPNLDLLWTLGFFKDRIALYPRISDTTLIWCEVEHLAHLRPADFGLREPEGDGSNKVPDLILVPGLLFSRDYHRLGRGAGHYDRFLCTLDGNCQKIGVCFRAQCVTELPAEEHDVRLDGVVTD
jgi:5-formyltetrahydrofolate cyclo-ligase